MASNGKNGKYGSDKANAVAATFGPVDKQLRAIEDAYEQAGSEDERTEVRQAVLDHLDPATMSKDRIRELQRAVGIVSPEEAEQLAQQAWEEKFPVMLSKPVNTRGAEIQQQIDGLMDRHNRGEKPYDDLGVLVPKLRTLQSEQKQIDEEFAEGPMAAYLKQQEEMAEFSAAARADRLGGSRGQSMLFIPDEADERDINAAIAALDEAERTQVAGTEGVKEIQAAESAEELTHVLAGIEGVRVEPRGEGWS